MNIILVVVIALGAVATDEGDSKIAEQTREYHTGCSWIKLDNQRTRFDRIGKDNKDSVGYLMFMPDVNTHISFRAEKINNENDNNK